VSVIKADDVTSVLGYCSKQCRDCNYYM